MFLGISLHAQEKIRYQPDYDVKRIHFGYFIGYAQTHYLMKFSEDFTNQGSNPNTFIITSPTSTGIKAGALINYYVNDYFDLRFTPLSVAVYARKILENNETKYNTVDKAWFEVPVQIKYKSERRKNSRMFVFGGLKYGIETNVVKRKGATNKTFTKSGDFSVEYGMGLELFREYFKLTPEIHFSHGFRNMVNKNLPQDNILNNIERMRTHAITFIIVFQ
ncbi:MAG: porin family protein [Leadbetterella sp.]